MTYQENKTDESNISTDIALLTIKDHELAVLLVKRAYPPYRNCWALPGGHLGVTEDAKAGIIRETLEETGVSIDNNYLEQLQTYTNPKRDPRCRMISIAYLAFMPILQKLKTSNETLEVKWWAVKDLEGPSAPALAFDHDQIIKDAVERCRSKLEYTTLATSFLQEPFTIGELRRIYEAVWGQKITHSNFHRKVKSINNFLIPAGKNNNIILYKKGSAKLIMPPIMRSDDMLEHKQQVNDIVS